MLYLIFVLLGLSVRLLCVGSPDFCTPGRGFKPSCRGGSLCLHHHTTLARWTIHGRGSEY